MAYVLTRGGVETELDAIRARAGALCSGLDAARFNWQPDGGRRWSIGQCLDHLTRTTRLYGERLEQAITPAPAANQEAAYPNLAGRWLIWAMEPPPMIRLPAVAALQPASTLDPDEVCRAFSASLDYLSVVAARALGIDASRVRYANPLARDTRMFNVATGVLVMLAHDRRHLFQAERVRQHRDFPTTSPAGPAAAGT
jgi:hypothetical protein